jgi:hypothetical protein
VIGRRFAPTRVPSGPRAQRLGGDDHRQFVQLDAGELRGSTGLRTDIR